MAEKILPILAPLLLLQGFYIFKKAKEYGYNHWLWGIIGLLNLPNSLIVFLLYSASQKRKNLKNLLLRSLVSGVVAMGVFLLVWIVLFHSLIFTSELIAFLILVFILAIAAYLLGEESSSSK